MRIFRSLYTRHTHRANGEGGYQDACGFHWLRTSQWPVGAGLMKAFSGKGRKGIVGTDYDMMLTFALMRANGSADTDAFIRNRLAGH